MKSQVDAFKLSEYLFNFGTGTYVYIMVSGKSENISIIFTLFLDKRRKYNQKIIGIR